MWSTILLMTILIFCTITDIRSRKIYNKIIFPGLLAAVTLHSLFNGLDGLLFSIQGFAVGLGILLIPYFMGGMGAGDVKLLALIGALKGTSFVLYTAIYMGLIGGIIALGILLFQKGLRQRMKRIIYGMASMKLGIKMELIDRTNLTKTYPYGVAIAAGAFINLVAKGWLVLW